MATRTIAACTNAVWGDAAHAFILCTVAFEEFSEPLPFRADASDPEPHGQALWAALLAGTYGPVSAYVAPAPVVVPVVLPAATILSRLTLDEYTAIMQAATAGLAAGNGQLSDWLDLARTTQGGVNLSNAATVAARAALIAGNLLTAARDAVVFAPVGVAGTGPNVIG